MLPTKLATADTMCDRPFSVPATLRASRFCGLYHSQKCCQHRWQHFTRGFGSGDLIESLRDQKGFRTKGLEWSCSGSGFYQVSGCLGTSVSYLFMLVGAQPKDHFKENYFVTIDLVVRFGRIQNSRLIKYLTLL